MSTQLSKERAPRLGTDTLRSVSADTIVPHYERSELRNGILHFGPGAFHRAHQAAYVDALLGKGDLSWGICGVSLRSSATRDRLAEQDCLYTLAVRDDVPSCRVIGSFKDVLAANGQQAQILYRFNDPDVRLATLTITEKGYCLTPAGDLDESHEDIQHDLKNPGFPNSAIGYLVEGYRRRRDNGLNAFTSLSCDNLVGNGDRLARAVVQFADLVDKDLAKWILDEACFPNSMVDSITPATDDDLRDYVMNSTGIYDAAPVQREAFTQWVIEDRFSAGRPALDEVGVTYTNNVAPYEQAKLRILNGLHSTLAYIGLIGGYTTVAEAMCDASIRRFLRQLVEVEILDSLKLADLGEYVDSIFRRFENSAIEYNLTQIAGDSSQKLPFRIMGTVADNLKDGRPVERLAVCIAGWIHFARKQTSAGNSLNDPLDAEIRQCAAACTGNAIGDIVEFGRLESTLRSEIMASKRFNAALIRAYSAIEAGKLSELLGDS